MRFIKPIAITDGLLGAGVSIPEDPTPAWAAGAYNEGDEVHLVSTHRVYRSAATGSSSVSPDVDTTRWKDMRATVRWAPFDLYANTQAYSTSTDLVFPITARFCRSVALYGCEGREWEITVHESASGALLQTYSGRLQQPPTGWYDYLFGARRRIPKVAVFDLPIRPAALVTVKIKAGGTRRRAVGMIVLGRLQPLFGVGGESGVEYGATASPVAYSYIDFDEDGQVTIIKRPKATNLKCRVHLPRSMADNALLLLQDALDTPMAWFATGVPGYGGLSAFGIASSSDVNYAGNAHAYIDLSIRGFSE